MNTATRLGAYGLGLAVVFGGAFAAADAVVPQSTVTHWTQQAKGHQMNTEMSSGSSTSGHAGHTGHTGQAASATEAAVHGVSSAQDGYLLTPVTAPGQIDKDGTLSFRILDAHGEPVTNYTTEHDKDLHLIVVRTDGTQFRHVHPTMATDGAWSLPWSWTAAGTYRVYADFVPAAKTDGETGGEAGGEAVTLTRTVEVAGSFAPMTPAPTKTASVDGYSVNLTGDLTAGSTADLTLSVTRDGQPVTTLQPYLGAFGHLVALREGDLAYLHVHPDGEEPTAGQTSGPDILFMTEVPTPGRYLLYLDFQVDGKVHSAPFVVDAARGTNTGTGTGTGQDDSMSDMGATHEPGGESGNGSSHNH
jgi:hypothetical protein